MFSIFMQKKYIYIYKNSWWSVWYRYRLQLENAIEKSIHKNKHFVITVWSHVYLVCIVYKKFDFFFFLRVCVCVWIFVKTACCAQWTDNHVFIPFEQYGVFFSFFYVCGSDGKIDKKKKKISSDESRIDSTFSKTSTKRKMKKKKREKEIKRRNKKKKGKYLIRYFLFFHLTHVYTYKKEERRWYLVIFFLQATMEWFFFTYWFDNESFLLKKKKKKKKKRKEKETRNSPNSPNWRGKRRRSSDQCTKIGIINRIQEHEEK